MPNILTLVSLPPLLLISIPLLFFAFLTTTLAFSTLLLRLLIVYLELALALLRTNFIPPSVPSKPKIIPKPSSPTRHKSRRQSSSNASTTKGSGSTTPVAPPTSGLGIYSSSNPSRDFEGVGGWRVSGLEDDEEDVLWTGMNSRLELPRPSGEDKRQKRHHVRSWTGGSLGMGLARSPGTTPTPRASRNGAERKGGGESPLEYFVARGASKSTTELDKGGFGKGILKLRRGDSEE